MTLGRISLSALFTFAIMANIAILQADDLEKQADWNAPKYVELQEALGLWAEESDLAEPQRTLLSALWPENPHATSPEANLARLAQTAVILDAKTQSLVKLVASIDYQSAPSEEPWLKDSESKLPALVRDNLRLQYGRWLAEQHLFDEAIEQLSDLEENPVADPAMLLFQKAICQHHLLNKAECIESLGKLLSNETEVSVRYLTVSKLMLSDISPLKEDSLDEVARLMRDIQRRLDKGRAGKTVRKEEEDVVAKLEKMIENLEEQQKQQQQQQQSGSGNGNQNQSAKPLEDSKPGGGKGPGNVNPRKLEDKSNWGDLPPKERQAALQQISNEFPSHYRRVIEEYFRKLAREDSESTP